jgi:hypothetical protein
VTEAARIADATSRPGTPLVFIVDDGDDTASFLATQAANVIRAAVPPDRVADVYIYVGTPERYFAGEPTVRGNPEYDALSDLYQRDIPDGPAVAFLLSSFDRDPEAIRAPGLFNWNGGVYSSVPPTTAPALGSARDPLDASSPWAIVLATIAILAFVSAIGFAWARWAGLDGVASAAASPAFGVATLVLSSVLVDRLGLRLGSGAGPWVASILAGGAGIALLFVQGKPATDTPPPIEQQPHE